MNCLDIISNLASILTAAIAAGASAYFWWDRGKKQKKLEDYLRDEKQREHDKGQRSLLHLTARLGMTESELLQASFRSRKINRRIGADPDTELASTILLEFKE